MEWSKHFPISCPPKDADAIASITVYRFLKCNDAKIEPEHFLTVREVSPNHEKYEKEDIECKACSLSVLTNNEDVLRLQKRVPRWRLPVAVGILDVTAGKIKYTPSKPMGNSHHSWWIPIDIKPCEFFNQIIPPPS